MGGAAMIVIPLPPSVNSLYRSFMQGRTVRTILSKVGREGIFIPLASIERPHVTLDGRLSVSIDLYFPTLRRCDIDNRIKGTLDVLTKAGVWVDDSQIDDLRIRRMGIDRVRPRAEVTVTPI